VKQVNIKTYRKKEKSWFIYNYWW